MTGRAVPEWIGKNPDAALPPRVKLRIFDRQNGLCAECGHRLYPGRFEYDHQVALILGGAHSEGNLRALCMGCHKTKTRSDVAVKSKTFRIRAKHNGIRKTRHPITGWKRFDGTPVRNPRLERA